MANILNTTYTLDLSYQDRNDIGYRYDSQFDGYAYSFPVYLCKGSPIIMCRMTIMDDNTLCFHVVSNGVTYAPFYNRDGLQSDVVKVIDKNIRRELKKLGAERVKKK